MPSFEQLQQAFAHGMNACVSKSKAKDIIGLSVGLRQNSANAGRQDMRFTSARASNDQHGPFNMVNCFALRNIQGI